MKLYHAAVEKIAREYADLAHDNLSAQPNHSAIDMIAFIYEKPTEQVYDLVMTMFKDNKSEWWK